ncbi:MAG: hypothetical protein KDD45_04525 [Bdellovibrionales bacterium]|nr:hypothetical protein [Bdellovibrionales bacterium]
MGHCRCIISSIQNNCPFHSVPFQINVTFPEDYPHGKPQIVVEKPHLFYHPNIFSSG